LPRIINHYYSGTDITLVIDTSDYGSNTSVNIKITGYPYNDFNYTISPIGSSTTNFTVSGYTLSFVSLQAYVKYPSSGTWSSAYNFITNGATSYPITNMPSYYPIVKDQWIWNRYTNQWYMESNDCVANSLSTVKEIHEHIEGKGAAKKYSIGWIYGDRTPSQDQSEGMMYTEALDQLQTVGVPEYQLIPENSTYKNGGYYFPDNYNYTDSTATGVTAKQLVSNNYSTLLPYALPQRIANYSSYTSFEVENIKQRVIQNGCVFIGLDLYDNFYPAAHSSSGIIPQFISGNYVIGHALVILGWKQIDNLWYWICQNSWGTIYGDGGLIYLPFYNNIPKTFYFITDGYYPPVIPDIPSAPLISSRIEGGYNVYWGAVSGATSYTLKYRNYIGTYTVTTSDTSITLSGLYFGTTYLLSVKAINSSGSSLYSPENQATTAPQTPTISTGTVTNNSIQVYIGTMSGNYDTVYVERYDTNGTLLETLSGSGSGSVTFNNLTSGTTYVFKAYSTFYINGTTLVCVSYSNTLTIQCSVRPANWSWISNVSSGADILISASEWNSFANRINLFRAYKSLASYGFTTVYSGWDWYAYVANQARNAINDMSPPTAVPSTVTSGVTDISAAFFNGLRDSLNSIT
jgi:hypothetical protein